MSIVLLLSFRPCMKRVRQRLRAVAIRKRILASGQVRTFSSPLNLFVHAQWGLSNTQAMPRPIVRSRHSPSYDPFRDLSLNRLPELERGTFDGLSNLATLYVWHPGLQYHMPPVLSRLPCLRAYRALDSGLATNMCGRVNVGKGAEVEIVCAAFLCQERKDSIRAQAG